ncbi:thermonuclease family protein [Vannielia litorea]|uniref:thermonuclease family protein n=1 Tax=Vannielia litorea TaxID=1217970 RepID=UPI0034E0CE8C
MTSDTWAPPTAIQYLRRQVLRNVLGSAGDCIPAHGGPTAKWGMQQLTMGKRVTYEGKYRGRWDRQVAQCFLPNGADLACEMIRHGYAIKYRRCEVAQ